MFFTRSTLC